MLTYEHDLNSLPFSLYAGYVVANTVKNVLAFGGFFIIALLGMKWLALGKEFYDEDDEDDDNTPQRQQNVSKKQQPKKQPAKQQAAKQQPKKQKGKKQTKKDK